MEFKLPDSPGWSAMHLANADWGGIALIVKREYERDGESFRPAPSPAGLVVTDSLDPERVDDKDQPIIRREAETALFKTRADILYLGRGTEQPAASGDPLHTAELRINGQVRRHFQRPGEGTDPVNLFGYQYRAARLNPPYDPDRFSFESEGADLFWSARRGGAFTIPTTALDLGGELAIELELTSHDNQGDDVAETLLSARLNLPELVAAPLIWEGGANRPAFWCRRPALPLVADTITLIHEAGLSVIWRAALPLSEYPLADLRRTEIREVV